MLRLVQATLQRPKGQGKSILYYDGACGMCRGVVAWLSRLDVLRRVSWVPFQSLAAPPVGLTWTDLDSAAYLRTPDGRLYEGFHAFRRLSLEIPALLPLAPLLWFPGLALAGVPMYRWVARNRRRIACALPGGKA